MHKLFGLGRLRILTMYGFGIVGSIGLIVAAQHIGVAAIDNAQWEDVYDGTVSAEPHSNTRYLPWHLGDCVEEQALVETYAGMIMTTLCPVQSPEVSLGAYALNGGPVQYAIKKTGDPTYRQLTNIFEPAQPLLLANNTLLTEMVGGPSNLKMVSLEDVQLKLKTQTSGVGPEYNTLYALDMAQATPIKDTIGNDIYTRHLAASQNNKYAVAEVYNTGIALIDLATHRAKLIANDKVSSYYGSGAAIRLAVSDDGKKVFVTGYGSLVGKMYLVDDECGGLVIRPDSKPEMPCDSIDLTDKIGAMVQQYGVPYFADFNDDSREAHTYLWNASTSTATKLTVRPDSNRERLDYLALGDSYSSGEGDTEKDSNGDKYYRPWTDREEDKMQGIPQNKCHISTRSYPYLLAKGMDLALDSPKQWDTVACNGATTWDVKAQASTSYLGRGDSLKGFDFTRLKSEALSSFIPGRQKQIEFVKKYKPRVVTLTIGGNDVGFGEKLNECASVSKEESTCSIATEEGRPGLGLQIRNQYDNLRSLYRELITATANRTKIYALGYPQFISGDEPAACGWNIGMLNSTERQMIHESVSYLNTVIEQASRFSGVKYVDIGGSLIGGRLCDEGQKYVTGISFGELQESFHPNAKGHFRMAMSVWDTSNSESLLDYHSCSGTTQNNCPDALATKDAIVTPDYFKTTELQQDTHYQEMTATDQTKTSTMDVTLPPSSFEKNSTVKFTLHSDPVDLGEFSVSSDGSLRMSIAVPKSIPAGYHTLIATGLSPDGQPIRYEQIILIKGASPDDIDENGVADSQQVCGPFMMSSGTDSDKDGVDDACDPEIGQPPVEPTPTPSSSPTPSPSSSPSPQPTGQNPVAVVVAVIIRQIVSIVMTIIKIVVQVAHSLRFGWW